MIACRRGLAASQWRSCLARHRAHRSGAQRQVHAVQKADVQHVPVLEKEILSFFQDCNMQVYIDGTLGAGGHAAAIMQHHPELRTLVGIDVDPTALDLATGRLEAQKPPATQLHLLPGNVSQLRELLRQVPACSDGACANGMLMDLGVSSMQLDRAERGFSFTRPGPLDMRMGPSATLTAEQLVNTWPEGELGRIIRDYGEERHWRGIASRIVAARQQEVLQTTDQLVAAVGGPRHSKGIHPATRTFQALRIAVNDELHALEASLPQAIACLAPGGRLGVISFHSLEDRIVKWAFLKASGRAPPQEDQLGQNMRLPQQQPAGPQAVVKVLTKRPLTAGDYETKQNPRSRSAKLRFVEKL